MTAGSLRLSRAGAVATLLIDRPHKRNSLDAATLRQFPEVLAAAAADPEVRVLIVTGGDGRDFSAGADIDEFDALDGDDAAIVEFERIFSTAQSAMAAFPKPVAAMISGACIGGGGLALGCDLRFADGTARFGITPAKLGLAYGLADTRRLVDAVGWSNAADLLFSARLIDAAQAQRIGLATIVETGGLLAHATAWAEQAAANAPSSLRSIKAALHRIRAGARDDDEASRASFIAAFAAADFAKSRRAFAERRRPEFSSQDQPGDCRQP